MLQQQANTYRDLLKVCLEASNCESFETWGFTDKYSWLAKPENGLPFDAQLNRKKAYYEMRGLLKSFPRNHPAVVARNSNIKNHHLMNLINMGAVTPAIYNGP